MLVAAPHPGLVRAIPLVIEGADTPRGRELSRLVAAHPRAAVTLELRRDGGVSEGFSFEGADDAELVFICDPGERSVRRIRAWLAAGLRVVDLSGATRALEAGLGPHDPHLVYGLPELARRALREAALVVAPGPLVTAATLALAPAAQAGFLSGSVELELEHARPGQLEQASSSEEIELQLLRLNRGAQPLRVFLSPRPRPGAGLGLRARLEAGRVTASGLRTLYQTYYAEAACVRVLEPGDQPDPRGGRVELAFTDQGGETELRCVLDDVRRGAPRQALRCMNLMVGLPERLGLDG